MAQALERAGLLMDQRRAIGLRTQHAVLAAIDEALRTLHRPPTTREIRLRTGRPDGSIDYALDRLEEGGFLRRQRGARNIVRLDRP